MLVVLLALGSAALYGASDYAAGSAARRIRVLPTTAVGYGVATAVLALWVAVRGDTWTSDAVRWGGLAGVAAIVGFLTFYAAMAFGPMSLVAPVNAVLVSAVPVVVAIATGQHLVWWGWLAVGGAALGGVLIAGDRSPQTAHLASRTLVLVLIAGIALGLSIAALDAAPSGSGIVPALVEVLVGLALLVVVVAVRATSRAVRTLLGLLDGEAPAVHGLTRRRAAAAAVLSGVLLGAANGMVVVALHRGNLATVGVLVGLYPVTTIVLARVIDKERLARLQSAGVVVAIVASAALSLA